MSMIVKRLLACSLVFLLAFSACRKDWDEHYERPEWLEPPIYQQLEERGNFTRLLACIDKAGYKDILSSSGYFTLFAPDDEAFGAFFRESEYSSVDEMDSLAARKLVTYSLVYNAFTLDRLSDYQSGLGWIEDQAWRRRTAYYRGVYSAQTPGGPRMLVDANRNGAYVFGDNNNKYIPYFTDAYFNTRNLDASDYAYFYPGREYTGFNAGPAAVTEADIRAENGMIHIVDQAFMPLPSIGEYLDEKSEYSAFRDLLERYAVTYTSQDEMTERYRQLTGSGDSVFVKQYLPELAFALNNENYLKEEDNDGQRDAWSLFVPDNASLQAYIDEVLLEHYPSLEALPLPIIIDFLNAHLWETGVWPSKFATTGNFLGEEARFDPVADIREARVLSNGMFYGTSKVQESNLFSSVYGRVYLDPKYSMMTRLLEGDLKFTISNPAVRFTLFMMSDEALEEAGFGYNELSGEWLYNGSASQAAQRLNRMLLFHFGITFGNELDDLSGKGVFSTYGAELIGFENNRVFAAGNLDEGEQVAVTDRVEMMNGVVYYLDGLLHFSERAPGLQLEENDQFSRYTEYLQASSLYNTADGSIDGVQIGDFYTLLIPSDEAMDQAVADGVLPADPHTGDFAEQELIRNFLRYHIIKKTVIADGREEGGFESLFTDIEGNTARVDIRVDAGRLQVTDQQGRIANTVPENSNVLADLSVIHQLDTYLKY